jgi:hypothetical protein
MADITPTNANVRWGSSERWQIFDRKAHPKRDPGGNPALLFRHGGGGVGGCLKDPFYDNVLSVGWMSLFQYLLAPEREFHFDIVSIETGQRGHLSGSGATNGTYVFPRSKKLWFHDQVSDMQRCVVGVKRAGLSIGSSDSDFMHPAKFILAGQSHGATLALHTMLHPPVSHGSYQRVSLDRTNEPGNFDSSVAGVLAFEPQIDARTKDWGDGAGSVAFLNYANYPGWFGTSSTDGGTQWNALSNDIKESMSVMSYIERGDTQYWVPTFVSYTPLGLSTQHPWSNAHDDRQLALILAAARARNLPIQGLLRQSTLSTSDCKQIYDWMVKTVTTAKDPAVKAGAVSYSF